MDPLSVQYAPPLHRVECVLLALLINLQQTHPKMGGLLVQVAVKLRENILSDHSSKFHLLCILW